MEGPAGPVQLVLLDEAEDGGRPSDGVFLLLGGHPSHLVGVGTDFTQKNGVLGGGIEKVFLPAFFPRIDMTGVDDAVAGGLFEAEAGHDTVELVSVIESTNEDHVA